MFSIAFGDDRAFLDQALSGFLDRHADRGIVIGGADDQVDLGQTTALVGLVMVGEGAARRFDDPNALSRVFGRTRWKSGDVISGSVASSTIRSAAYSSSIRRAQWIARRWWTALPPSVS